MKPLCRLVSVSFVLTCILVSTVCAQPSSHIKPNMPDLDQRDPSRPSGGKFHCTPTAAANSLQWFDNQGINTVDGDPNALVNDLANNFLKTNGGTWTDDLVKGLRSYLDGRFLQTGKLWDVKFQGSTWNRGYTVGQKATTPSMNWIKSELADDEDVLLNVQWYTETAPGSGTYTPGGGHTITASGFLGDDLLISDPWYPELIIEPTTVAGVPQPSYRYSTDPNNPNLIAVIREAISVSPKDFLVFDGLIDPFELYEPPPSPTCTTCLYKTDYIDYLSLGIDFKDIAQPLTPDDLVFVDIFRPDVDPVASTGVRVVYDGNGLLDVLQWDPEAGDFVIPLSPEMARVMSGIGISLDDPSLPPHLQSELFINKESLGNFAVDSFFDITYQIDFAGEPGPSGLLGEQLLLPQQATIDEPPWIEPVPQEYPNPEPPEFDLEEMDFRMFIEDEIYRIATDFNGDGVINAADFTVWRDSLGTLVRSGEGADANFDGIVDELDYLAWRQRFGQVVGSFIGSQDAATTVPEPSVLVILACGLIGWAAGRRSAF